MISVDELFDNCEVVCYAEGTIFLRVAGGNFSRHDWWKTWQAEYEMRGFTQKQAMQDFLSKWLLWECRELEKLNKTKVL